jgi:hypothetical protein
MGDLMHFASKVPTGGGRVYIRAKDVAEARRRCQPLIGWSAILIKALALTAKKWPELRQSYMPFPWAHLYEHPYCVATLVVERRWQDENTVFFYRIHRPEDLSLREIDNDLREMKSAKVESVRAFRRLIRITRLPLPLRRLLWIIALRGSGRLRTRYFGSYSLNSISGRNIQASQSLTVLGTSWFYGPINADGFMPLEVFFDHRIIDGSNIKRMIDDLETTLSRDIVAELNQGH